MQFPHELFSPYFFVITQNFFFFVNVNFKGKLYDISSVVEYISEINNGRPLDSPFTLTKALNYIRTRNPYGIYSTASAFLFVCLSEDILS